MAKKINLDTQDIDLTCFDENQQKVVLQLAQKIADQVTEVNDDSQEYLDMPVEHQALIAKDARKAKKMTELWKSGGYIPGLRDRVTFKEFAGHSQKWDEQFQREAADAGFTSTDHPILIARTISEVVKEAVEPNITLTPLLQRINYSHGTTLTFPAMGAFPAADIAEGMEYPERSIDFAGQTVATIGKSGVAVKMTEEMIRYSQYDVMSMNLRAAGRALIRWKESKVASMITTNAGGSNTIFDNTSAIYPSTTGRDAGGTYNGTLTLDDLFKAYAEMINRGYNPNTLIMNPFGWQIFADEAIARAFGFINGLAMWQQLQGSPAQVGAFSGPSPLLSQSQPTSPQNLATTFTNVPTQFPVAFNIIVSPFVDYNATNGTTDLILCDRNELGIIVVDEEVTTDEFKDPARDIYKVKLRERYGLASLNNGSGTGLIKAVHLKRGFDFSRSLQATIASTGLGSPLTGDETNYSVIS